MPKAAAYIAAANQGEFGPRLDGRVDFDKYGIAVSRAHNLIPMPQGGLTMRPGTRMVKEVKSSANRTRLRQFEASTSDSYVLEIGNPNAAPATGYIRFYQNQTRLQCPTVSTVVTNGTFPLNIGSWTNRSTGPPAPSPATATISWDGVGLRMLLDGAADGYAWAEQAIAVSNGDKGTLHVFRFTIAGDPGSTATVQIGAVSLGTSTWEPIVYGIGQHTIGITPSDDPLVANTLYFQVINKSEDNVYLDTVEVLSNTPLELTNAPWTATSIINLRYAQSNDVLYMFHRNYAPYRLDHRGDYSWSLTKPFFEDGPWQELNPDIDLAAANLVKNPGFDTGLGIYWTTVEDDGHVVYDGAQGVVFFQLSEGQNFKNVAIRQTITTGAPGQVHVLHYQLVGSGKVKVELGTTAGAVDIVTESHDAGWYSLAFTPPISNPPIPSNYTFYLEYHITDTLDDVADVPGVGASFIYNVRHNLLQPSAVSGEAVTVTALGDFAPFRATDIGRSIRIEYAGREAGWGVITAYTDTQHVTVRVYRLFADTAPTETWRLGSWSDTTGWPRACTFFQQRLFTARTTNEPQTIWASQSGDFQNFRMDSWVEGATTVEDDDALGYIIATKLGAPIQWFSGTRKLVIGTTAGQFPVATRGVAATPSDFSAEPHTSVRSAYVEPVEVDSVAIFVSRDKQAIYDLGFDYQIDGFKAADLTILADHMAGSGDGFQEIDFQSRPYAQLWARRDDGKVASLTYKREQSVVGWAPQTIAGTNATVESVAVIPGGAAARSQVLSSLGRDELWMVVKRTINGSTVRYIEVMEGYFRGPNRAEYDTIAEWRTAMFTAQKNAVYVDSAITFTGTGSTITGLSHLEGEVVYANVDGKAQGPFTVASGQITGVNPVVVTKAQVGLRYPWRMRGLKMNSGAASGTSVGQTKQIGSMTLCVLDSGSFQYGIESTGEKGRDPVLYTMSEHLVNNSYSLFSGEVPLDKADGDWDTDPRFVFTGYGPLPWTFTALMAKVSTNER